MLHLFFDYLLDYVGLACLVFPLLVWYCLFKGEQGTVDNPTSEARGPNASNLTPIIASKLREGGYNPLRDVSGCVLYLNDEMGRGGAVLFYSRLFSVSMTEAHAYVEKVLKEFGHKL